MSPENRPDDILDKVFSLHEAISSKSYPRLYKELRRFPGVLSPETALSLLEYSLDCGLTRRAFEAILEHSRPAPEILFEDNQRKFRFGIHGLLEYAASRDRSDILSLFLERGASPNRISGPGFIDSPLETALANNSPKSVEVLMRHPGLDTAWTERLLFLWAKPRGPRSRLDACIRAMAPRFTGWDPLSGQPLPIPEPMTAEIITRHQNWPLLKRFCRERGSVSLEDGRDALEVFKWNHIALATLEEQQYACADALAGLLETCSGLLQREEECRELLGCFLKFDGEAQDRLRPWAESLSGRRIAMDYNKWFCVGYDKMPERWQKLLPNGPTLVIDRWDDIFRDVFTMDAKLFAYNFGGSPQPERTLRHILDACPIRGEGRKGELSPLAETVLRCGDAALIESLLRRSGGLLATEDPVELIRCALHGGCPPANSAAVLAFVHKEPDYEL